MPSREDLSLPLSPLQPPPPPPLPPRPECRLPACLLLTVRREPAKSHLCPAAGCAPPHSSRVWPSKERADPPLAVHAAPCDDATALIEVPRGYSLLEGASQFTRPASSDLGSIPNLSLSSCGTWAGHLGLFTLKRGLIE